MAINGFKGFSADQTAGVIGGAVSGVAGILGGIVGGRKRRQEQRAAKQELASQMQSFKDFEFENAFANMQNPFEDLTVNTQQAEFQAQQQQQGMANTLDQLRQSGGGMGAAALAQALVGQQRQGLQGISASIGMQEAANARMSAQGAAQMQMAEAQGAMAVQGQEFDRESTLLGMSQQRLAAADAARAQATQSLVGGIGSLAGAAVGFAGAGGFAKAAVGKAYNFVAPTVTNSFNQ
jgi:hypothetical protein